MSSSARIRLALLLSGIGSLLQETVWNREWVLIFGATTGATGAVLAVFMGGLGLGGLWYSTIARYTRCRGRALYRRLEVVVAIYALVGPILLALADQTHLALLGALGLESGLLPALRVLLVAAVLLPPTIAMGATLPALCGVAPTATDHDDQEVSQLYAWNTFGAVLGVGLGAYLMMPYLGNRLTFVIAAGFELAAAAVVGRPSADEYRAPDDPASPSETTDPVSTARTGRQAWVLALYAFVGFWALALEVLLSRAIAAAAGATTFAFAAVLGAFLAGMALGARLGGVPTKPEDAETTLGRRLGALGLVVLGCAWLLPNYAEVYLRIFPLFNGWIGGEVATWSLAIFFLLPPGLGLGALFPVAARCLVVEGSEDSVGNAVGQAYFVNSMGGACGALAAVYLIAPQTGVQGGIYAAGIALTLAAAYVLGRGRQKLWIEAGVLVLVAINAPGTRPALPFRITHTSYRMGDLGVARYRTLARRPPKIVWYRDGPDASVAVTTWDEKDFTLRINGKTDASLNKDMGSQVALGLVPILFSPDNFDALMIGLGAGASADSLLALKPKSLAVAELSPTVALAAREVFGRTFPRPYQDPAARILLMDGRNLIRSWPTQVDLIVSEPTNVFIRGVANLYTREFFRACRQRLRSGGVLVQWLQDYHVTDESLREVLRTMQAEFPYVMLTWYDDFVILASDEPIRFDLERTRARLEVPEVKALMSAAGLRADPEVFIERLIAWDEALRRWTGPGSMVTDDLPSLEYLTSLGRFHADSPGLDKALQELRLTPDSKPALPVVGLLVSSGPDEHSFPWASVRRRSPDPGQAHLERVQPRKMVGGNLGLNGEGVIHYGKWRWRHAESDVELQSWPIRTLPDPRIPHQQIANRTGSPSLRVWTTPMNGHKALWQRHAKSKVLLASWVCKPSGRSFIFKVREASDTSIGVEEYMRGLECVHP